MLGALGGGGRDGRNFSFYLKPVILRRMPEKIFLRDLSEISRGGRGVETEGGSQLFETQKRGGGHEKWAAKRGRVTQICAPDHVEAHPQKTKEVLYFVKKTTTKNCEV